jgi:hypothetical protein
MIRQAWLRAGICLVLALLLLGAAQPAKAQQTAQLSISPQISSVQMGQTFQVSVNVADVVGLFAFELNVAFPPHLLQVVSVENGGFLTPWIAIPFIDNEAGLARLDVSQGPVPANDPAPPQSGSGTLMLITFQAQANLGEGDLLIAESILSDIDGLPMDYQAQGGSVRVCDGIYCLRVFLPLAIN